MANRFRFMASPLRYCFEIPSRLDSATQTGRLDYMASLRYIPVKKRSQVWWEGRDGLVGNGAGLVENTK